MLDYSLAGILANKHYKPICQVIVRIDWEHTEEDKDILLMIGGAMRLRVLSRERTRC